MSAQIKPKMCALDSFSLNKIKPNRVERMTIKMLLMVRIDVCGRLIFV